MSFGVKLNDGSTLSCGDINQIGIDGSIYWFTRGNNGINANNIYQGMIKNGYTTPTIEWTDANLELVKNVDYDTITAFQTQFYWLVGDIQRGGLCFSLSGAPTNPTLTMFRVQTAIDATSAFTWRKYNVIPPQINMDPEGGTAYELYDTIVYPIHYFYRNGQIVDGSSGTNFGYWLMVTPNYGFLFGYWEGLQQKYFLSNTLDMREFTEFSIPVEIIKRPQPYLTPAQAGGTVQWIDWWSGLEKFTDDPNQGGGYAGPSGGGGAFDNTSDIIPFPELPPNVLFESGIYKVFAPNIQQTNDFINYLYTQATDFYENIKKMWIDPMDSIISFGTVPFAVSAPTSDYVRFCGVNTNISMPVVTSQYMTIDCGTLALPRYWGGALDQNSYTKLKLFLPFIGFASLNADECMGGEISVKYNVDLLTGDCMAFVRMAKADSVFDLEIDGAIYSYRGNVLCSAPLTGNSYAGLYSGIINTIAAVAMPSPASVAGIAKEVMGQKVEVQHSGSISPNAGYLGEYTPFVIIERPIQSLALGFDSMCGYPCNDTQTLSALSGYTEIDPETFKTTKIPHILDDEAEELLQILENGVIF